MIVKNTSNNNDIYLESLRKLVLTFLSAYDVKVYLYGSRAKGTYSKTSDVDIAIMPCEKIPKDLLAKLREKVEESNIPYTVDIIDLSTVSSNFRDEVLKKTIIWKDCNKK